VAEHAWTRWLGLAALCAGLGCASAHPWGAAHDARLLGRASARGGQALGHAVVFLEPMGPGQIAPAPPVVIQQRLGRFEPDFAVAQVGQAVRFSNADRIFHGVFSYSDPNRFEERPFAPGESREVVFRHPGVVQLYSPIDAGMRGMIAVIPAGLHTVPDGDGNYELGGITPGRYRLSLWSDLQGATTQEISLAPGEVQRADLVVHRRPARAPRADAR
jgi:plastocyanin